ncbi:unnamed protein product [Amoebophrya sp. A25]|nr:unnamed protein product [Amoebophrya sp. A25]|eukprot:GSA25T00025618001.1
MAESCCPPGSWPLLVADKDYEPKGLLSVIDQDIPIYVSGDAATGKGVIVLPEIFGFEGRLKNICDTIAENGYFVVMPDCHRGDSAKGKENIPAWVKECDDKNPVTKDLAKVVSYFESKGVPATSLSAIGHCWGTWAWVQGVAEGDLKLRCGLGPHPSIKLEQFAFGRSQEDMCKKAVEKAGGALPVLLITAGNDPPNVKAGGELVEILKAETFDFPEQQHGWFSRGDVSNPEVKAAVEKTMTMVVEFLKKHH